MLDQYPRYETPKTTVGPITYHYTPSYYWPTPEPTLQGWECPKCGRCYSPWTTQCAHCVPFYNVKVSGGTWPGQEEAK